MGGVGGVGGVGVMEVITFISNSLSPTLPSPSGYTMALERKKKTHLYSSHPYLTRSLLAFSITWWNLFSPTAFLLFVVFRAHEANIITSISSAVL